ncbi:hypothetical protein NP568_24250, partial [Vibrio parahaemolyticus]|nr:hypothetical protein [Vibrio parahaemolyticus]
MEILYLKECQQPMAALDAADKLNASVEKDLSQFKNMDPLAIINRSIKMLMTGNLSIESFW